jgi:hypothetical protein
VAYDDPAGRLFAGADAEIAVRIAAHDDPLFVLMTPGGEGHVGASLARHDLTAGFAPCRRIAAGIGRPLALCPARRS